MAFIKEQSKVPSSIGDISVVITDLEDPTENDQVHYSVQVLQTDGSIFRVATGNLVPHLTQNQINSLVAFMATLRAKAEAELLP